MNLAKDFNSTVLNKSHRILIRKWEVWDYNLLALLTFAIIGNTLTLLVMRSKSMRKTNASLLLSCMAVADITILLLKFLITMQKMYRIPLNQFCVFFQYFLPDIAAFSSYWFIIITTMERCIAVWYPMKVTQIITKKRCLVLIIIMVCFFTILSSTQFACLEGQLDQPHFCKVKGGENNQSSCVYYYRTLYPYIKSALMSWIPSVLAVVLNSLIIISLAKATLKRKGICNGKINSGIRLSNYQIRRKKFELKPLSEDCKKCLIVESNLSNLTQNPAVTKNVTKNKEIQNKPLNVTSRIHLSQERQITIMLIAISLTFLILTLPFSIHELSRKLYPQSKHFTRFTQRLVIFMLDCLNATNFILYCLVGKKFRKELKNIFQYQLNKRCNNLRLNQENN